MDRTLIIVARDRPHLLQYLSEHHSPELQIILDRRRIPRPPTQVSEPWPADLERNGYMVASTE